MKKVTMIILALLLSLSLAGIASADFISNPGFEILETVGFADWTEGNFVNVNSDPLGVYAGTYSALLTPRGDIGTGNYLYQAFTINEGSSLYYGAWLRVATTAMSGNFDQMQISVQIDSLPWTTIGDSISNLGLTFTPFSGGYLSNWFLLANTIPVSSIPMNAAININLQNWDSDATKVFVDNTFAQSVPEPTTMLLLGFGLVGLAGARRLKK